MRFALSITGKGLLSCNVVGEMANICQGKLVPGNECTALIFLRFHDPPSHVSACFASFLLLICGGNQQLSFSTVYLSFRPAASCVQDNQLTIETVTPVDETENQYRLENSRRKRCLFAPLPLYWYCHQGDISATLSPSRHSTRGAIAYDCNGYVAPGTVRGEYSGTGPLRRRAGRR